MTARKYNPGFLTDDELVATFCVRTQEFASMIEAVRDTPEGANTHQIVIGPRGSGKTSLLLRVAAEIRRDAELSARFFPVVFAEESYEVSTAGEFWLECLSRLADQAPPEDNGPDLHRTHEELRQIEDDRTLGDRCLGVLQDFADRHGKRLVLIVENLNMMFDDFADDDAGWRLRQTLQTDPRFLLLASATSRFDEIDNPKQALYDLFRVLTLRPLDTDGCATLWRTVSGQDRAARTIQALRILTGGSPRLLTIVAKFGGEMSFRELMADLLDLVDDHTEYFKSHLETLAAQERRVYLALADLWKPATTREIAERARLDTSKCSAHLARLTDRGAVEVTGGSARRKLYYLSERLYNIYYLMRRARGPAPMIEALIRFMEGYYSVDELKEFGTRLVGEATEYDSKTLLLGRTAFARLIELPSLAAHREELLSLAPVTLADTIHGLSDVSAASSAAKALFERVLVLGKGDQLSEALDVCDEIVRRFGSSRVTEELSQVAFALVYKGMKFGSQNRPEEALITWDEILRRFRSSDDTLNSNVIAIALFHKGKILAQLGRKEDALAVWNEVVELFEHDDDPIAQEMIAESLVNKGWELVQLHRLAEAVDASDEVLRRFGSSETRKIQHHVSNALLNKVIALVSSNRPEEALVNCNEVLHRNRNKDAPEALEVVALALASKGALLFGLDRSQEALAVWEEVLQRFETNENPELRDAAEFALCMKAEFELNGGRADSAIAALDRALEREGKGLPETRWRAHLQRARTLLTEGNNAACLPDVEAALAILPDLNSLPKAALDDLSELAVELGLERMRDLIKASPAADLLLPLTTALELELGEEPRVAKEVEEVAEDIRRDMAERRKAKNG